ncbi:MAG: DUF4260 domain-containing protein [Thermales bacterium]|nr:DUF4260 domain-containing protein [Thermales bacterium]
MKSNLPESIKILLNWEYIFLFFFFLVNIISYNQFNWWIIILFWFPDVSFAGYLINKKVGAISYNITHFYGTAIILWLIAFFANNSNLSYLAMIQLAHISFDRLLGFGLKYPNSFQKTHLKFIDKIKIKKYLSPKKSKFS